MCSLIRPPQSTHPFAEAKPALHRDFPSPRSTPNQTWDPWVESINIHLPNQTRCEAVRQRCVQHVHPRLLAAGVDVAPVHQHGEPIGGGAGGGVAAEQRQTTPPGAWPGPGSSARGRSQRPGTARRSRWTSAAARRCRPRRLCVPKSVDTRAVASASVWMRAAVVSARNG